MGLPEFGEKDQDFCASPNTIIFNRLRLGTVKRSESLLSVVTTML